MTDKAWGQEVGVRTPVRPSSRLWGWLDRHMVVLFNLPTAVFLVGLIAFPAALVLWTSLTDWQLVLNQEAAFVGLSNYLTIWSDERWLNGMFNTFYYAIVSVAGQFVLGMATALVFNRQFAGKSFYRSIWMMPMISMSVAISLWCGRSSSTTPTAS